MKKTYFFLVSIILSVFVILSCKTVENAIPKSSQKDVTTLALSGIANATSVFDQATGTYTFTVPTGTNIKALALTFSIPTGAKSSPASGSTQDFTSPVTYTITAEDGTSTKYTVKINVQTASKSSAKQILTFSFGELNPVVQATINNATFEVTATIPATANIKSLKPTITVSDKSTISPLSGVSQDFTSPVKYIVTAEDGTMQVFMVKVTVQIIAPPTGGSVRDVYVAGIYDGYIASYWKNNVVVYLTSSSSESDRQNPASANSIFVNDNNDVFVAGNQRLNGKEVAKYWKNGVVVNLTDGKYNANASSIFVSGNDVYVAGYETYSSGFFVAKYWKNGVGVNLSSTTAYNYASSIFVSGNDVFVAGNQVFGGGGNQVAKYWKNGVEGNLTDGKKNSYANSIAVSGNDIYVAGVEAEDEINQASFIAKYWKNGVAVNLSNGHIANSIFLNGNDIYVAGFETTRVYFPEKAKYWKNGTMVDLSTSFVDYGVSSNAQSIVVKDNVVYVAGNNTSVNYSEQGKYWKNGVEVFLSKFTMLTPTRANCIFVK